MAHPSSRKIIIAALLGNFLISITKFIASWLSGSSAMLSEGIHSLVDTGNQVLLLYGIKRSAKPADENFPFGHGKEIYFWSFVVAILIFAVGAGVSIYEGVIRVLHPSAISNYLINYIVLGVSIVFESIAWYMAVKEFKTRKGKNSINRAIRDEKDPALIVVLFEDSAAMLGLFTALIALGLAQASGWIYFDGIASIIIGCILGGTAIWLAYETKSLLIGESANSATVAGIRNIASSIECIESVQEVLTMHMGPDFVLAAINADFDDNIPVGQLEKSIAEFDKKVRDKHPEIKRVFVEAQAATKK